MTKTKLIRSMNHNGLLKTLWDYRHLTIAALRYEFQAQYTKSIFGSFWIIMNPLYMCIIYTAIFSSIININTNHFSYTIYVATGLLTWSYFTEILNRSQIIYASYASLIKQQNFPVLCLPIVVLFMATIDFLISFGLFSLYLIAIGAFPGWYYIALIPILLLQAIYAISLGTILGALNIFFRDISKITTILLQLWFWITPIVYFIEKLPTSFQWGLRLNPITAIIEAYQAILVHHQWPQWNSLWYSLFTTLLISGLLLHFYQNHFSDFLDEL